MDFNLTLASFEPLLAGVRNLLELCQQAKQNGHPPHFAFISSISVFRGTFGIIRIASVLPVFRMLRARSGFDGSGLAPEAPIEEPRWAAGVGYGESKWVAEQVMASASAAGIDGTIVRVGQLSGDTGVGGWSPQEWVPALVGVSQKLGCLPSRDDVSMTCRMRASRFTLALCVHSMRMLTRWCLSRI